MKTIISFFTIFILLFLKVHSQQLADTTNEYKTIKQFLINNGEWNKACIDKPALIGFRCLIDSLKNRPCGIYSFNRMSSDARIYFYFKNKDGKAKIVSDFRLTACLQELNTFFNRNNRCFTNADAINYTAEILTILKGKYEGNIP